MPAALMDNFDRGSPFSQSDSQSPQDWSTVQSDGHKLQQREKNRDAARKTRRKQTEKADILHEELQTLEQSNAAYVKEIDELRKEIQIYTTALEQHEPHCTKLSLCGPSLPISVCPSTATPPTSDFTFVSEPNPLQDLGFLSASPHNSLTDLLDSSDWSSWD
ncbi:basic leucine zipper transcriptional factor ATF-like isoform X2 [Myxocyprinus asiaticus]|uniref:basic leucine zipper transcriptional factor ATF-like isoform X2 n=1 Tax=Myxocyprinus asiaticus TaxID=70543 RepID=UPI00222290AE|nr:basic leucine zipper transcriptional factor ATF-like isoform X2 [Myxocyprinus asiaticus]